MRFLVKRVLVSFLFLILGVGSALAESDPPSETPIDIKDFFPESTIKDVVPQEVVYRPSQFDFIKSEELKAKEQKMAKERSAETAKATTKPKKLSDISRESIISEFGDPNEPPLLLGDEKAPPSMKGLQHALQINDQELAAKYARQFSQYLVITRQRLHDVMGYVGVAMQKEGTLSSQDWPADPAYRPYQEIFEELESRKEPLSDEEKVNTIAKKILNDERWLTEVSKDSIEDTSGISEKFNEKKERAKIRAELAKRSIPRDKTGVIVLAFFRPNAAETGRILPTLKKIDQMTFTDQRIGFVANTMESTSDAELNLFKQQTGTTFKIDDGSQLARELKITQAPTFAFVGISSGTIHLEVGAKDFYYIDELIKLMIGGK